MIFFNRNLDFPEKQQNYCEKQGTSWRVYIGFKLKKKRKISWYAYLRKRSFNMCGKQNNTTPSKQFQGPLENS